MKPHEVALELVANLGSMGFPMTYAGSRDGGALSGVGGPEGRRYMLWRRWGDQIEIDGTDGPPAVFCMLNPSQADHSKNDPTITRCLTWAKSHWRRSGLVVVNVWSLRETKSKSLRHSTELQHEADDLVLRRIFNEWPDIVVAWGDGLWDRDRRNQIRVIVQSTGAQARCFGKTVNGNPKHPVRLAYETPMEPWP